MKAQPTVQGEVGPNYCMGESASGGVGRTDAPPPSRREAERDPHVDAAGMKAEAQRRQAAVVARYRAAHAEATGSDKAVALCAALEAEFGRREQ